MQAAATAVKLNWIGHQGSQQFNANLTLEIGTDIPNFLESDIQCFLVAVADRFGKIEEHLYSNKLNDIERNLCP